MNGSGIKRWDEYATEELRARARATDNGHASWNEWTRDMLLAFFRNRHGLTDTNYLRSETDAAFHE